MNVTTLGIDLAKNVFQLHGVDRHGKTVLTKRVTRMKLRGDGREPAALPDRFGGVWRRALLSAGA